jgi:hypothetical protein
VVFVILALAALVGVVGHPGAVAAATPQFSLTAVPATIVHGDATKLTVRGSVPGATLTLSRRYAGALDFTAVGTTVADGSGRAVWTSRPSGNATYKVETAGGAAETTPTAEAEVGVRPRVKLQAGATKPVLEGRRIVFSVSVRPVQPGKVVRLERKNGDGGVLIKDLVLGDASTARFSWRADRPGALVVRARVAADAERLAGQSAAWKTTVYDRRNPYGVPTRYPHLILVDLSQYKLYYHEHGQVIRVFDCVLGRPGLPTPKGHYRIYAKDTNVGGPYGPRRMRYLGAYAIHGTNEPWLLNRFPRNYSHGCTRLANTNILWLYARVPVGTPVWNVP